MRRVTRVRPWSSMPRLPWAPVAVLLALAGCSEETQNRLSRLGVTWLEGDYRITFAEGSFVRSWEVRGGKVTSDPDKGYYYFWARVDGKNRYVQTPIARTIIEEIQQPGESGWLSWTRLAGDRVRPLLAPFGVFALLARAFATQGLDPLLPLAAYFLTLTGALAIQMLAVYPALLTLLAGQRAGAFLRKMRDPAAFAFSTSSSAAIIPVTLRTLEARMGVRPSVAAFNVPLGATVNMDGTAMMQGVATVFIANVYGVALDPAQYRIVVVTATLPSIGTAAVPSAGLVMLTQVGPPVEGIALIIGVDRLLDMMRTVCNVTGDCAVTCVVARSEGAIDLDVYRDPGAGRVPPPHLERAPA